MTSAHCIKQHFNSCILYQLKLLDTIQVSLTQGELQQIVIKVQIIFTNLDNGCSCNQAKALSNQETINQSQLPIMEQCNFPRNACVNCHSHILKLCCFIFWGQGTLTPGNCLDILFLAAFSEVICHYPLLGLKRNDCPKDTQVASYRCHNSLLQVLQNSHLLIRRVELHTEICTFQHPTGHCTVHPKINLDVSLLKKKKCMQKCVHRNYAQKMLR